MAVWTADRYFQKLSAYTIRTKILALKCWRILFNLLALSVVDPKRIPCGPFVTTWIVAFFF